MRRPLRLQVRAEMGFRMWFTMVMNVRTHSKFEAIKLADEMMYHVYGPVEGR